MSNEEGRVPEQALIVPALMLLVAAPNFQMRTAEIRERLERMFNVTGKDAEVVDGQTRFSQKVRNLVSNRTKGNNIVHLGLADYIPHPEKQNQGSLAMNVAGLSLLENIGFKVTDRKRDEIRAAEAGREPAPPPQKRPRKPKA
ncbi:hypothetical protein [Roseicella sp. DB1501]|uniref:hypothetical protein n=1 Tax=Roseicella sp. DB1501 TaxID=2730925 RepID=UPI00149133D8|nr:hypothetical protein [Roseicella sp. DB1501]NOG71324.1 hypothetical protein [Roseicella sp. DB1501]